MTAFLLIAAFAILAAMKLYGFIAWSWWIVIIPVLIPALFIVGAFVLVAISVLAIPIGAIVTLIAFGIVWIIDEIEFYLIKRRIKNRINKERANDRQS